MGSSPHGRQSVRRIHSLQRAAGARKQPMTARKTLLDRCAAGLIALPLRRAVQPPSIEPVVLQCEPCRENFVARVPDRWTALLACAILAGWEVCNGWPKTRCDFCFQKSHG